MAKFNYSHAREIQIKCCNIFSQAFHQLYSTYSSTSVRDLFSEKILMAVIIMCIDYVECTYILINVVCLILFIHTRYNFQFNYIFIFRLKIHPYTKVTMLVTKEETLFEKELRSKKINNRLIIFHRQERKIFQKRVCS